ncbi:hypothetical protein OAL75_03260 [Candidatus Pelagibacter ubique]|nr:hypothetical protein [Candidatus Pelagibacter ubique]
MSKNVYYHVDELGRDSITACALKKAFAERGYNLVYGNRAYTKRVLEHFVFAFDIIILPRQQFLKVFKDLNKKMPPIVVVFTESVGCRVNENNDKGTLWALLGEPFMEGDTSLVDKVTSFCLWGETTKKRIDKYYPEISNKFYVTGHPRYDKRCMNYNKKNSSSGKVKIGLITRNGMLNDFGNRQPIQAILSSYHNSEASYFYNNKQTGDFLASSEEPIDDIYKEAVDIKVLLQLLSKLNETGHEIYLKIHPRENVDLWLNFVKKYNLNLTLADWRTQFAHWVKDLDYVIGPASTSFYDCCVAGVQPIGTHRVIKNRDYHINEFSEENNALMKHIITPDSIDEIIQIVSKKNESFELSENIKKVLLNEANFPESINSIEKIVDVSIASQKKNQVSPLLKNIYMIGFYLYGNFIVNLWLRIHNFLLRKTEQGSTFLMTRKNRKFIDSIID